MWLMTRHGFFSIVQKEPGIFHVRSKERGDLENLIRGAPLPGARIQDSNRSDYAVGVLAEREDLDTDSQFSWDNSLTFHLIS
jgi:hypothetical protein